MEFKFRAVDNVKPETTSHSPSPVIYLPDRSLQMNHGFSGFRQPLTGEEALRRELEKEVIRREMLRRLELEEEVRREIEIERKLGISIPRPLNMQGLLSQWSNSSTMNPVAVGHIGASQPPLILPPTEINPAPEISDKDKIIVLTKPDPELYNAKRKATTVAVSETEPSAFDLKKKLKKEWSCSLCEIKATSESGLNAHLNGKKHKIKEARQYKKSCRSNRKSGKLVNVKATEVVDTMMVNKLENESKNEVQLIETVADNDIRVTQSKNEKKLCEMMADNIVTKCENGEMLEEKSQCVGFLKSDQDTATEETGKGKFINQRKES
ncbi:hypothetical protein RYX36_027916 [Vicia faba]